jgi:peptidoglycan/LPS O-acetylase OafA/YrhL
MSAYVKDLAQRVLTVFLTALGGMMAAATPFDVVTFGWVRALTVAASAAVLALVLGLVAKLTGTPDSAGIGQ